MSDSPFYCDLTALSTEQRKSYESLIPRMMSTFKQIDELPSGYRLPFTPESDALLTAAQFMSFESLCCPFLDFSLQVLSNDDRAYLDITGPEGVKDFLQAELGMLQADQPN